MSASSKKAIALALTANGGIAISKFGVFALTGSSSLLTEAIHSTADCANQVLLFIGLREGAKEADAKHPLGKGQAPFVASFLVALLLFTVGGLYSVVEGIHKIRHPESPHHLIWAVALVVLAEDIAALVGLVFALAAVLLVMMTGDPVWDGIGSVAIGLLLIAIAAFVGTEVTSLLLNEAPPLALRAALREAVDEETEVDQVLNLIAVFVGSERLMVALKVKFRDQPTGQALIDTINALERRLKARFPQIQHLFVEPDDAA